MAAKSAIAKLLQSCPTLCDPIDGSPPGSPVPGKSESEKWMSSRSVVFDSLRPHGLQPTKLLHPWDFPGKSTRVGCHCLLRSSTYLRLLTFLPAILIPACASSSLAFHMIYFAYKLNKQSDTIQPWCTPFPVSNQSCSMPGSVASWPVYRFLRRQVRWSGIPISLRIFHSLLWFTQSVKIGSKIRYTPSNGGLKT